MQKNPYMHTPVSYVDPHTHRPDPKGTSIPLSAEKSMYQYSLRTCICTYNRCAADTNLSHLLKH